MKRKSLEENYSNIHWKDIQLNEQMNQTVKECLEMREDNISLYALKRIDELEKQLQQSETNFKNYVNKNKGIFV